MWRGMRFCDATGIGPELSQKIHSKFYSSFEQGTLNGSEIVLCATEAPKFGQEKKVKYLVCNMTNTDHIDVPVGARVVSLRDQNLERITSTAEHTIYLMLAMVKRKTRKEPPGFVLNNKSVYILGNRGRVGRQLANIFTAFNMAVYGSDIEGLNHSDFSLADFITVNVSVNKNSNPVIGYDEMALVKDGAYIVNTSRPVCVNNEAILGHLYRMGGYASDFKLPDAFKNFDNVFSTDHVGGWTIEDLKKTSDMCFNNFWRDINGNRNGK